MDVDVLVRVPVREQEPKVRATNFEEVCYGYNEEEADYHDKRQDIFIVITPFKFKFIK